MQVKVLQNAPREHSAILLTFIKLPFTIKIFVLSIFEWRLKTSFTVLSTYAQTPHLDPHADVAVGLGAILSLGPQV